MLALGRFHFICFPDFAIIVAAGALVPLSSGAGRVQGYPCFIQNILAIDNFVKDKIRQTLFNVGYSQQITLADSNRQHLFRLSDAIEMTEENCGTSRALTHYGLMALAQVMA